MSTILETAAKALNLHKHGKSNPEIKKALGLAGYMDVNRMISVGRKQAYIDEAALTPTELRVLLKLAEHERERNRSGDVSAFTLGKWNRGADLRVIRKRMGTHRKGEPETQVLFGRMYPAPGTGLGLIRHWHGGYCRLTQAGWALVHALEGAL